jgi:hypothetical protein
MSEFSWNVRNDKPRKLPEAFPSSLCFYKWNRADAGLLSVLWQLPTSIQTFVHRKAQPESGRNLSAILRQRNGDLWGEAASRKLGSIVILAAEWAA